MLRRTLQNFVKKFSKTDSENAQVLLKARREIDPVRGLKREILKFEALWEDMKAKDIGDGSVGKRSVVVVMGFYLAQGMPRKAVQVFEEAFPVHVSYKPDEPCYLQLTEAYATLGDPSTIAIIRTKLRQMKTTLSASHHLAFLKALRVAFKSTYNRDPAKKPELEKVALSLLQELRASEPIPLPKQVYRSALLLSASVAAAEKLLETMRHDMKCGIYATGGVPEILKICAEAKDLATAKRYYYEICLEYQRHDPGVHLAMVKVAAATGAVNLCYKIIENFKSTGHVLKPSFATAQRVGLLKACAAAASRGKVQTDKIIPFAEKIFTQQYYTDAGKDLSPWGALLAVYCSCGDLDKLEAFVSGAPPVLVTLASSKLLLAEAYATRDPEKSAELLREVETSRAGMPPPPPLPEVAMPARPRSPHEKTKERLARKRAGEKAARA
eukprot:TRINITY_DN19717_c0_g1_i1.p1 TRINITY_DN19717_c0_g1~~TRINITY_DN19717_c0_g1_i1.p1  ORF type:complete len:476 (+),score=66.22 TRINITY_DN19717_c0_g1_i1:107-1429(+)